MAEAREICCQSYIGSTGFESTRAMEPRVNNFWCQIRRSPGRIMGPSARDLEDAITMATAKITGYHAHVYFDQPTVEQARALREKISEEFDYAVGRFHEKNVGPHPRWSFQIAFEADEFGTVVPWLALNRKGLTVFVHGLSGDDIYDHTELVFWLGDSVQLDLDGLT